MTVIRWNPRTVGSYWTEQDADEPIWFPKEHGEFVKRPVLFVVKLIMPVGALVSPLDLSRTVATHVIRMPNVSTEGQLTTVVVAILLKTMTVVLPLLDS